MHDAPHRSDMKPAYVGLVCGAIALLIMCVTIVKLTNAHYNGEKSAAEATH